MFQPLPVAVGSWGEPQTVTRSARGTLPPPMRKARVPVETADHITVSNDMVLAYQLLRAMTEAQRGRVLCWFCKTCHKYVGPGLSCSHPEDR